MLGVRVSRINFQTSRVMIERRADVRAITGAVNASAAACVGRAGSRRFGAYREIVEGEPVMMMHCNKPLVVIESAAVSERLRRRDKRVIATEELPEWLIDQIANSEMDPRHNHLDEK